MPSSLAQRIDDALDDHRLLQRIDDAEYVSEASIKILYRRAAAEGRLCPIVAHELGLETGTARCNVCGILCWDDAEAKACCAGMEHLRAHMPPKPPRGAVALCVNRAELKRASKELMYRLGYDYLHQMVMANGLPERMLSKLHSGESKMISQVNWLRLCFLFGGPPPGCVELREGEYDD